MRSSSTSTAGRFVPEDRRRSGFSLIEVALALVVAAGGMLAIFGVFPISLRQSSNARSDMGEMTFATTVLETIAGNVRTIDRIDVWNDPAQFWNVAVGGTGLPRFKESGKFVTSAQMKRDYDRALSGQLTDPFSPATTYVAKTWKAQKQFETTDSEDGENIWYFGEESESTPQNSDTAKIAKPAQYLIRLAVVRRAARRASGNSGSDITAPASDSRHPDVTVYAPNVYIVSIVSTDRGYPDVYIREPLYSQEYTFIHRP